MFKIHDNIEIIINMVSIKIEMHNMFSGQHYSVKVGTKKIPCQLVSCFGEREITRTIYCLQLPYLN